MSNFVTLLHNHATITTNFAEIYMEISWINIINATFYTGKSHRVREDTDT